MLNHYSDQCMPDIYSRIQDANDVIKKPTNIRQKTYDAIIADVCKETPDFSWTGWILYGRDKDHECIQMRIDQCKYHLEKFISAVRRIVLAKKVYYKWIQVACRPPKYYSRQDKGGTLFLLDYEMFEQNTPIIKLTNGMGNFVIN